MVLAASSAFRRAIELIEVRRGMSIGRTVLVQKDCSMMTLRISAAAVADSVSGSCRIAVGQRVRKRKKRLIGSVAVGLVSCLLFCTLIVELALLLPFEVVATVNDDGHR